MGVFGLSWVFVRETQVEQMVLCWLLRDCFGDLCLRPKLPPMCDRTALYDEHKAQLLVQATDGVQTGQLIF